MLHKPCGVHCYAVPFCERLICFPVGVHLPVVTVCVVVKQLKSFPVDSYFRVDRHGCEHNMRRLRPATHPVTVDGTHARFVCTFVI